MAADPVEKKQSVRAKMKVSKDLGNFHVLSQFITTTANYKMQVVQVVLCTCISLSHLIKCLSSIPNCAAIHFTDV